MKKTDAPWFFLADQIHLTQRIRPVPADFRASWSKRFERKRPVQRLVRPSWDSERTRYQTLFPNDKVNLNGEWMDSRIGNITTNQMNSPVIRCENQLFLFPSSRYCCWPESVFSWSCNMQYVGCLFRCTHFVWATMLQPSMVRLRLLFKTLFGIPLRVLNSAVEISPRFSFTEVGKGQRLIWSQQWVPTLM